MTFDLEPSPRHSSIRPWREIDERLNSRHKTWTLAFMIMMLLLLLPPLNSANTTTDTMISFKLPPSPRPLRTPLMTQRTRSSRLFFLLLHLAGVSTNLPSCKRPRMGITADPIYLERLHVESSRRGLSGLLDRFDGSVLEIPYWFQLGDKCLGIGIFGECGDTSLWRIRRKLVSGREKRRRRRLGNRMDSSQVRRVCVWPFFCERGSRVSHAHHEGWEDEKKLSEEDYHEGGFALEWMEANPTAIDHFYNEDRLQTTFSFRDQTDGNRGGGESTIHPQCLVSYPSRGDFALQLGPCSSEEAWLWQVDQQGRLMRGLTRGERRKRRWIGSPRVFGCKKGEMSDSGAAEDTLELNCVHRVNGTGAVLFPCSGYNQQQPTLHSDDSLVRFSLVRYPSGSFRGGSTFSNGDQSPWVTLEGTSSNQSDLKKNSNESQPSTVNTSTQHMPTSRTNSQNHASGSRQRHADVKSTEYMLHTGLVQGTSRKTTTVRTSASHIREASEAEAHAEMQFVKIPQGDSMDMETGGSQSSLIHREKTHHKGDAQAREKERMDSNHRSIKIPVHPYIEASKDGIWVDPLTSLQYPTDLCEYLGQTKKESGRHTLMGVGQYYRTAFSIKVYGAALYVAKRDVLADPKFGKFATMSSEELRNRDDFYDHLMNMPEPGNDPKKSVGGFFDRTIMVKTNMQLSTDAMRKSLEADWSLLTDEMKSLITESSFRERIADERMIRKIQSKENSSNCSCGQKAPPEYGAEPTCCARGTELAFTWRKNGDFEVRYNRVDQVQDPRIYLMIPHFVPHRKIRLDGRVMDIFPRPDMAKGIFTEYMNTNPISLDAKAHFTDGFPFLLAPLAQVKGMSSAVPISQEFTKKRSSHSTSNPMYRFLDSAMDSIDAINVQVHTFSRRMQDRAAEISSMLNYSLGNVAGIAHGFAAEFERQRMDLLDSAFTIHNEGMKILSLLMQPSLHEGGSSALALPNQFKMPFSGRTFFDEDEVDPPIHDIMPDEIGIEMDPTMNFTHWLFFTTVHIYLMLLFVVSLQGSYSTKFVVKRKIKDVS